MSMNEIAPIGSVTPDMKTAWQYDLDNGRTYSEIANSSINQRTLKPYNIQTIRKHTNPSINKQQNQLPSILDIPSRKYASNTYDILPLIYSTPITPTKAIPSDYYNKYSNGITSWDELSSGQRTEILGMTSTILCSSWFRGPSQDLSQIMDFEHQATEAACCVGNSAARTAAEYGASYQIGVATALACSHIVATYPVFESINYLQEKHHISNEDYRSACFLYGEILYRDFIDSPGLLLLSELRNKQWQESPYSIVAYLAYIQTLIHPGEKEPEYNPQVPLERTDMNLANRFAATCVNGTLDFKKLRTETLFGSFCASVALEEGLAPWIKIHPSYVFASNDE